MCQVDEQLAAHFRAGQDALRQGNAAHAVEEFKKVLTLDPTLVEAEVNLGLAYHSLAEYNLAASCLAKALRTRPDLLAANVIAGADYLKIGSPEKAVPFLERALKLDASNREAREALASAYVTEEKFGPASEEFREIAELDPDKPKAWFKLGHEYLDLSARLAYRGARLYRESAWGHRFLGDLLSQRALWEDAAREYSKALSLDSKQPGLHTSLAQAYLHGGKLQDANTEFHRELDLDPKYELAWLGLAASALQQGQTADALRNISEVWNISPEFLAMQRDFPSIDVSPDSAETMIHQLQGSGAAGAPAHFLLAALYAADKKSAESEQQETAFDHDFAE